jgi:multiple sugar transport system permease protein
MTQVLTADGDGSPSSAARMSWWRNHKASLAPYVFIAPNLILFTVFVFIPLLYALYVSFHEWTLIGAPEFNGIANYQRLVQDPLFWQALENTIIYTLGCVPLALAFGLALAIGLNQDLPGRTILRSIYFMPVVVSGVVTAMTAAWLFNDNYGVINAILRQFGAGPVPWLSSPRWVMTSLIATTLWIRVGFCMVVYLAALQTIEPTYYDAAEIDGASRLQQFRHVTLPQLRPMTFLLLIINIIFSFHVFDLVYVMTGGGPGFSSTMLVQYVFLSAFANSEMGYACAIGIVLFVLILAFTVIFWRLNRHMENVT